MNEKSFNRKRIKLLRKYMLKSRAFICVCYTLAALSIAFFAACAVFVTLPNGEKTSLVFSVLGVLTFFPAAVMAGLELPVRLRFRRCRKELGDKALADSVDDLAKPKLINGNFSICVNFVFALRRGVVISHDKVLWVYSKSVNARGTEYAYIHTAKHKYCLDKNGNNFAKVYTEVLSNTGRNVLNGYTKETKKQFKAIKAHEKAE